MRSLTPASHGNAIGIGLADVASKSLVDQIDPDSIFVNALSSMTPTTAKTPMHFDRSRGARRRRSASRAATPGTPASSASRARWRSTASSETYRDEIASRSDLRIVSEPEPLTFDGAGNFASSDDLAAAH